MGDCKIAPCQCAPSLWTTCVHSSQKHIVYRSLLQYIIYLLPFLWNYHVQTAEPSIWEIIYLLPVCKHKLSDIPLVVINVHFLSLSAMQTIDNSLSILSAPPPPVTASLKKCAQIFLVFVTACVYILCLPPCFILPAHFLLLPFCSVHVK